MVLLALLSIVIVADAVVPLGPGWRIVSAPGAKVCPALSVLVKFPVVNTSWAAGPVLPTVSKRTPEPLVWLAAFHLLSASTIWLCCCGVRLGFYIHVDR